MAEQKKPGDRAAREAADETTPVPVTTGDQPVMRTNEEGVPVLDRRHTHVTVKYLGKLEPPFGVMGERSLTHYVYTGEPLDVLADDAPALLREDKLWQEAK